MRLQDLNKAPSQPNLNMNDVSHSLNILKVKQYLKGANPELGRMSLDNLRNNMQAQNKNFEDVQRDALRRQEREMATEIQSMKKEK